MTMKAFSVIVSGLPSGSPPFGVGKVSCGHQSIRSWQYEALCGNAESMWGGLGAATAWVQDSPILKRCKEYLIAALEAVIGLQLVDTCSWATMPSMPIRSRMHSAICPSRHLGPCVGASSSWGTFWRWGGGGGGGSFWRWVVEGVVAVSGAGWWREWWHFLALGGGGGGGTFWRWGGGEWW
jgi:hypothetical protein